MAGSSDRVGELDETNLAACPFSVRQIDNNESRQKKRNQVGTNDDAGYRGNEIPVQVSHFRSSADSDSLKSMDVHYEVEPTERWSEMTRYNSFALNECKFKVDDYVSVSCGNSIDPRIEEEEWVARILEIRASDERHVYARIYWMYRPDKLPQITVDRGDKVQGRQSYHGEDELIASNHMDIINIVKVTEKTTVNFDEDDHDQVQHSFYCRQVFNIQNQKLSSIKSFCICKQPPNPDRRMIECPRCSDWFHEGGPLSIRCHEEREEQAAVAARIQSASPAPGPAAAGAQQDIPCLPCLKSALGGRSSGACFELAGAKRANHCARCSSGHKCYRLPSAVRAAARELVSLLEAKADKKEIAKARSDVRELLKEHPELLEDEQPSEDEPSDEDEDEDEDDDEDEEENELAGRSAARAARRAELKKTAKAGLHALVELIFDESE
ncbi:hypothetical protein FJTKL_15365 [Diaporthe vaccinii]|uniref:BAH domain-containing protein n=1 Tax=Diaporthe vaccinii TaxID=105482 RepID=A0ABR4E522_9PEZI